MRFVLSQQLWHIVVATCAQDRSALWPDLREELVNSCVHAEVQVNHKTKQLEWLSMIFTRVQNNKVLFGWVKRNSVSAASCMNTRLALC